MKLLAKTAPSAPRRMPRSVAPALVLVLAVLGLLPAVPAGAAATTVRINQVIPYSGSFTNPCALAGAGEEVAVSGNAHVQGQVTVDEQGGLHGVSNLNLQGVSGTGLITGDRYRFVDGSHTAITVAEAYQNTFTWQFLFVGEGSATTARVRITAHVTVLPTGEASVDVAFDGFDCA